MAALRIARETAAVNIALHSAMSPAEVAALPMEFVDVVIAMAVEGAGDG